MANKVYDLTIYQTVLYESAAAQPNSAFKQMFPSLHFETGGFFTDDRFEIDRIGDWGCDLLCANDWWIPDELLTTDNGGPGGVVRHTGSAYIENTGGDGGPVVPTIFNGVPNAANENLLQIYGRLLYPEGDRVRRRPAVRSSGRDVRPRRRPSPPPPTAPPTATGTVTSTPTPVATSTATPPSTATATATVTATFSATPTSTPTRTSDPDRHQHVHRDGDADGHRDADGERHRLGVRNATDTRPRRPRRRRRRSASRPRARAAGTPGAGQALFQLRDSASDKALWRWSRGDASTLAVSAAPSRRPSTRSASTTTPAAPRNVGDGRAHPARRDLRRIACWKPNARGFKYKGQEPTPTASTA